MRSILSRFGKRTAILTVVGSLAITGSALAFFVATASGTGGGNASITNAPNPVTLDISAPDASGMLTPGGSALQLTYTVTNNSASKAKVNSATASIPHDANGDVYSDTANTHVVTGCKASWFTPTIPSGQLPAGQVPAGGSFPMNVDVAMTNGDGTGSDQTACAGHAVNVQLAVS